MAAAAQSGYNRKWRKENGDSDVQPQPEVELPHARPEEEPQARPEVEPHARAEVEPRARAEVEPHARAEVEQPLVRPEVEPDSRPEVDLPQARPEVEPHARTEVELQHARPEVQLSRARTEVELPHARPEVCLWSDLDYEESVRVLSMRGKFDEIREFMAGKFGLDSNSSKRDAILEQFHFYNLQFAGNIGFDARQTSALFSLFLRLHQHATSTPRDNLDDTFAYFKELLCRHSVRRPPFSCDVFDKRQAHAILKYAIDTYFRHFRMYKYVFTPKVTMDLTLEYEGVEREAASVTDSVRNVEEFPGVEVGKVEESQVKAEEKSPERKQLESLIRKEVKHQLEDLRMKVKEKAEGKGKKVGKETAQESVVKESQKTKRKEGRKKAKRRKSPRK